MAEQTQEQVLTFPCKIITPSSTVFEGDVDGIQGMSVQGALEIYARHEPVMTPLAIGVLTLVCGKEEKKFAAHGGFLDMTGTECIILADSAESADTIDQERAQAALARAKERLAAVTTEGDQLKVDMDRAQLALLRAITRLQILEVNIAEE